MECEDRNKYIYSVYSTFKFNRGNNEVKHCIKNKTYPFILAQFIIGNI